MAAAGPPDAVGHFDEFPDLGQPRGDGDLVALEVARPALTVPLLVRGTDRLLHPDGQSDVFGQAPGQSRVLSDHSIEVVSPGHGELNTDPEPVQRRVAAPHHSEHGQHAAHGTKLVVVLAGLHGDVVAKPLGLLVGVGVAAHVDQQGRVVDDRALLFANADTLGQSQGDHALAKDVLHRLAKSQVDPEGQGGQQLRKPYPARIVPAPSVHDTEAIGPRPRRIGPRSPRADLSPIVVRRIRACATAGTALRRTHVAERHVLPSTTQPVLRFGDRG